MLSCALRSVAPDKLDSIRRRLLHCRIARSPEDFYANDSAVGSGWLPTLHFTMNLYLINGAAHKTGIEETPVELSQGSLE